MGIGGADGYTLEGSTAVATGTYCGGDEALLLQLPHRQQHAHMQITNRAKNSSDTPAESLSVEYQSVVKEKTT